MWSTRRPAGAFAWWLDNPPAYRRHLIQDSNSGVVMNGILAAGTSIVALFALASTRSREAAPAFASDTVRVRVFELVDDRGQVRSRLNVEPDGEVVLRLMDQSGTIRVKLGAGRDGSGMVLLNDATEPGVHLLSKPAGSSVRVRNKDGRERLLAP